MRSTRLRALACAGFVAAALGLVHAQRQPDQDAGQPPAPAQNQPPLFRTGINFVRVDVIVSDKSGANLADLKQSDFEVTEDGKPQQIQTFKLIKLDGGAVPTADGPPRPIRTDYDEETEAARDDVRLFAVFLDEYHVRKNNSIGVREPLSRFIQTQLAPSDMIGIMTPLESVSSVRMTRDRDAVVRGIEHFVGRKYEYEPKNDVEAQYSTYPTEIVERIRNEVSLSALKGLIVHMGSLKEGRKALIVVSEGYSYILPPQMRNSIATVPGSGNPDAFNPQAGGTTSVTEDQANFAATADMLQDLRNVYDEANRQNVALYTLDPRGLTAFEFDLSDPAINLQTDRQYLNSTMETLRTLADQTDGRAIVNRNDLLGGMKQIVRDSSGYYLLGYTSSQAPTDGKFHEIKVRVKHPGVQVRARKGYWASTAQDVARATAPPRPGTPHAVESALATVNTPSHARVVRTWIGTDRGANGKTRVTLVWEPVPKQPGDRAPAAGETPARVSVMAVGEDGAPYFRGRVPDMALASAAPSAAAATDSAPRAPARVTFDAKPGKMQLRLSVEGGGSQVLDSEVREVVVPDLTSTQTALGTPEVFRGRTAREFQQLKSDPQAVPVATREFSRTDRLLVRVPAYGAGTPMVTSHLLNRTGQPMSELPAAVSPQNPSEHTIEVPLAGLAPGEYVLEVKAVGDSGEAKELVGFRVTG